ncbi:hypothetical protein B0H14DRAFT_2632908 [Mycena olivaceomarginata]|nr:hypothetical protein B0H14DRAFT_2632908 [Mycena olivaceomarginata]
MHDCGDFESGTAQGIIVAEDERKKEAARIYGDVAQVSQDIVKERLMGLEAECEQMKTKGLPPKPHLPIVDYQCGTVDADPSLLQPGDNPGMCRPSLPYDCLCSASGHRFTNRLPTGYSQVMTAPVSPTPPALPTSSFAALPPLMSFRPSVEELDEIDEPRGAPPLQFSSHILQDYEWMGVEFVSARSGSLCVTVRNISLKSWELCVATFGPRGLLGSACASNKALRIPSALLRPRRPAWTARVIGAGDKDINVLLQFRVLRRERSGDLERSHTIHQNMSSRCDRTTISSRFTTRLGQFLTHFEGKGLPPIWRSHPEGKEHVKTRRERVVGRR